MSGQKSFQAIAAVLLGLWIVSTGRAESFTQVTDPPGIFYAQATNETGVVLTSINAPRVVGDRRFSYWRREQLSVRDVLGRALNPFSFLFIADTEATAVYVPADQDSTSNAVPDWWEYEFYADGVTNTQADTDQDGINISDEFSKDYHPNVIDALPAGGLTLSYSPPATLITDTNLVVYSRGSAPVGILPTERIITNRGAVIVLEDQYREASGRRFAYWTLDGVVLTDRVGRAASSYQFVLESNAVAEAVFVDANVDSDGDAIADWYEFHYLLSTAATATASTDADVFDLAIEYERDYHPLLADEVPAGGVTLSYSPPAELIANTNLVVFEKGSLPEGIVPAERTITNRGAVIMLDDQYGVAGARRFAYWTLNGVILTDSVGRAASSYRVELQSDAVAQAVFIDSTADADGDEVPDWYELHYLLSTNAGSTDGDAFVLLTEYERDYHPGILDEIPSGGLTLCYSPRRELIVASNLVTCDVSSDPPGVVPDVHIVDSPGTVCVLPDQHGVSHGRRFAYWDLNGSILTDAVGRAVSAYEFLLESNTVAVAVFVDEDADSDGDGVADWFELNYLGTTGVVGDASYDGDAFDLLTEYQRGYHPGLVDAIPPGGLVLSYTPTITLNMTYWPRVQSVLFDGQPEIFFSRDTNSGFPFLVETNAHPALGDWDGDGDLDLFVGFRAGDVRAFENRGNPTVMNLYDVTTNFVGLLSAVPVVTNLAPALGDWDGDGDDDLALGGEGGAVILVRSPGSMRADVSNGVVQVLQTGHVLAVPAMGDITTDGHVDLLILTETGLVRCFVNTGISDSPFSAAATIEDVLNVRVPSATALSVHDINDDGVLDILISDQNGNIWEFHGDAD